MLSLEDPKWANLTHAYGPAQDIPDLLRLLAHSTGQKADYKDEPWFSLWSALCHQGDVFDASYAALPHIVKIATDADGPIDFSFFQLPAAIEIARNNGLGPQVPPDLNPAYQSGLAGLLDCVTRHLDDDWGQDALISAMTALAVGKGQHRVAKALLNLDDDLITRLIDLDF
tara:strand:- start:27436 stop:27948 length:513 start_codon:yes stop_codon:yes gene_type:complete